VKRFYADDSAATSVKVGYRQASYKRKTPVSLSALKIALSANRGFFSSANTHLRETGYSSSS
ncbi:hypothetical protein, partial [Massilia frigida]|uniref:hypothetical protein n=1 Tax=Massilia frigida TaxID=2609281 RepID=UPI001CB7554E